MPSALEKEVRTMKKLLIILLVLSLALSLASCGNTTNGGSSAETTTAPPPGGEPVPGENGVVTDPGRLRVGIVYATDPESDPASAREKDSFDRAAETFGLAEENIYEACGGFYDDSGFLEAVGEMASGGCAVVFTADRSLMKYTASAAEKYPDVTFCNLGGYMTNGGNLKNHRQRLYQAAYLCGMTAAYKNESVENGRLGYICGGRSAVDRACANAFVLGAQAWTNHLDTDITVYLVTASPEEEISAAKTLIESGCTFVGGCTPESLYLEALAEAGIPGSGAYLALDAEKYPALTASATVDTAPYYLSVLEAVAAGQRDGISNSFGGFDGKEVGFQSDVGSSETDAAFTDALDKVAARFADGSWDVFCGRALDFDTQAGSATVSDREAPIYKTSGAQAHQTAYGSLDDGVIFETMDYFVFGVEEVRN